jgi:hypothetical protein
MSVSTDRRVYVIGAFWAIALVLALVTTARADLVEAEVASEDPTAIEDIVEHGAPVRVTAALSRFDLWYVEETIRGPEVFYAGAITSYDVMVARRGFQPYHTILYAWDALPPGTTARDIVYPVFFSGRYFDADGRVFELSFWHQHMHRPGS